MNDRDDQAKSGAAPKRAHSDAKSAYTKPVLVKYGSVRDLTRSGNGSGLDGGLVAGMTMISDRLAKENIARIGTHPMGFGIYLFDYKPALRGACGHGRQFGVMADEVAPICPDAIVEKANSYKAVDYSKIGISHA